MSTNNTSMVSIMFEEIKQLLKQLLELKQSVQPTVNLQELERKLTTLNEKKDNVLLEKLSKLEESIVAPKPQKHQHKVTIDIRFVMGIYVIGFNVCYDSNFSGSTFQANRKNFSSRRQ